jgi:hypothetical protein
MKEIDKKIADLVKEAEEKYENVDLFIFSDH